VIIKENQKYIRYKVNYIRIENIINNVEIMWNPIDALQYEPKLLYHLISYLFIFLFY